MARKKKSKNSSIGYSGSVTVKVMHGNKTVRQVTTKNSGTLRLFKYIANCLGNTYEVNYAPRMLRCFTDAHDVGDLVAEKQMADMTAFVDISTNDNASDTASVTFSFLISSNMINQESPITAFALYSVRDSADVSNMMAYVFLSAEDEIAVTSGENYLIEWTLSLQNVAE